MARQVVFFPAEGESGSPVQFIDQIGDKDEQQTLKLRLEMLSQREPHQWNMGWCKRYEKIWQVRTNHYRAIIFVEQNRLIVLDVFKKQTGRTEKIDRERRQRRLTAYLAYLETTPHAKK
jgi:mRNA-degrading endonuclease RelE of RelBE toxin-antitoxin system